MASADANKPANAFPLSRSIVCLRRDGSSTVQPMGAGPPPSGDGLNIGLAELDRAPPHDGERHPDGDELIILISGAICIVLEEEPVRTVRLAPGEGFVVPRGVWHRLIVESPSSLVHVTPGPANDYRPKPPA